MEHALLGWLDLGRRQFGQVAIETSRDGKFFLRHHEDRKGDDLQRFFEASDAEVIAKFDDAENFRPLKTAPNLRHGWQLELNDRAELREALDHFYPGRLAIARAAETGELSITPLRETLERQTGMYRVAAKIDDAQADALVGNFCRSQGGKPGCLRTILWPRDAAGTPASVQLPPEKFDPTCDQTGGSESVIPLLCQEPCNLLVAEARRVVKETTEAK